MDFDWGASLAATISRGLNAAVDITIAKEIAGTPGFLPNVNQLTTTQPIATATAGTVLGVQASSLVPLLLVAAGLVVAVKLAKG